MNFKKTLCTCLGCLAGAACIILSGGTATPLVAAVAVGVGGVAGHLVGHKLEKDEKKTKNTERQTQNQQKIIDTILQQNKTQQAEIDSIKQKREEFAEQKQQTQKDLQNAKTKANDPDLSEEERRSWRLKVVELEEKLSRDEAEDKKLAERIGELQNQIGNNNKTISSVGSVAYDKKQGIWEFLTLENILIAFAIYALWQIIREDNRR